MTKFKQGVSFVAVLIALLVASLGGGFNFAPGNSEVTVEPTDYEPYGEVEGGRGLHW